jgi:hypothetical protein
VLSLARDKRSILWLCQRQIWWMWINHVIAQWCCFVVRWIIRVSGRQYGTSCQNDCLFVLSLLVCCRTLSWFLQSWTCLISLFLMLLVHSFRHWQIVPANITLHVCLFVRSQASTPKGFKCTGGIMAEEAVALFRCFYEQGNPNGLYFCMHVLLCNDL